MKKIISIIFILIFTSFLILWAKGRDMREIQTEIEINAPLKKVWSILADVSKWQDWSPIINKASGAASFGSKLNITMCGKDGKAGKAGPQYEPVITVFEEPRHFSWQAKMAAGFIFTNGKVFQLEETSSGGTRLIHKETFSGMMVPMMWGQMERSVPTMLASMNEALKQKAEKKSD